MMMPDHLLGDGVVDGALLRLGVLDSVVRLMNLTPLGAASASAAFSSVFQNSFVIAKPENAIVTSPAGAAGADASGARNLVDVILGDELARDHGLGLDLFALQELEDEVDAFLAHLVGVLADGGVGFHRPGSP